MNINKVYANICYIKYITNIIKKNITKNKFKDTCKVFKVSETTLTRWIKRSKENNLENKIRERKPKKIYPDKLVEYINKNPDAYLVEIAEEFNCTEGAIRKALKRQGITRKKRQLHTRNNVPKK
ncbi:MAG: IS630 transposase-related protein [Romboutsia sp.]